MTSVLRSWTNTADYAEGSVVLHKGSLYSSSVATGPSTTNNVEPGSLGQTVWRPENLTPGSFPPYTPDPPSLAPVAPIGLRVSNVGDAQISLAWSPLVDSYEVQWREANEPFSNDRSVSVTGASATISNLTNDSSYFFRARAFSNWRGYGNWTFELPATPQASTTPVLEQPGTPNKPTATPKRKAILFEWTPGSGGAVETYSIQWKEAGGSVWTKADVGSSTSHLAVVEDLNTTYHAHVMAKNASGESRWSVLSDPAAPLAPVDDLSHTFTETRTWLWPYDDLTSAIVVLKGGQGGRGGGGGGGGAVHATSLTNGAGGAGGGSGDSGIDLGGDGGSDATDQKRHANGGDASGRGAVAAAVVTLSKPAPGSMRQSTEGEVMDGAIRPDMADVLLMRSTALVLGVGVAAGSEVTEQTPTMEPQVAAVAVVGRLEGWETHRL